MRYGAEHKSQTRERLVVAASRLLRVKGLAALAVAEVMREADLTHGGFYGYFDDKKALLLEALRTSMRDYWSEIIERKGDLGQRYISRKNRDNPAEGCPLVALAGDVSRADPDIKATFAQELTLIVATLAEHEALTTDEAAARLSQWVGAVLLARAVGDSPLADTFLRIHPRK